MNETKLDNMNAKTASWNKEIVIDQIWKEFYGIATRSAIEQVISNIALKYEDARIKTYIPIFVHREAVKRLRAEQALNLQKVDVQSGGELTI